MWVSAKFGTCTVVSVNGTLVEDKMRWSKGENAHFSCSKCPIYTLDGASAKFSTNSHKTDISEGTSTRLYFTINVQSCRLHLKCFEDRTFSYLLLTTIVRNNANFERQRYPSILAIFLHKILTVWYLNLTVNAIHGFCAVISLRIIIVTQRYFQTQNYN